MRRQGKWEDAYAYLDKAINQLESYRQTFVSERSNIGLIKGFRWIYEAMIDCCVYLGPENPQMRIQAYNLVEKTKWHTFTTLLRFVPLELPDAIPEYSLKEERVLLNKITDICLGEPTHAVKSEDIENIRRLESIWKEWEDKYPDYVAIRRQKNTEAIDVPSLLDDQVPLLVEYYLGDELGIELAFVIHKSDKAPIIVRLRDSPQNLDKLVKCLCPQNDQTPPSVNFDTISHQLYQSIMEPVLPFLPEGVGVCIVPYGSLHNIPFSGLYDGNKYFIERNPIVIAQSATALNWWVKKNKRDPRSCLIFTPTTRSLGMSDLIKFKNLAKKKISPLFLESRIIDPDHATKDELKKELASGDGSCTWDVIHIACHGVFKDNGLDSYLVMANVPGEEANNLTALEIFGNIRTNATLVTLSACDSSMTEAATGDDIAGLTQAFLFSGSSSVLASVWYVLVGVGIDLIRRFYELWIKGDNGKPLSKIMALQEAQKEVFNKKTLWGMGHKEWPNPYDWAPFQLYGDWR